MKIGNIIFENELVNHSKVEYINYINEATSYDELDKTLPTLYVGWSFMKECNPNNEIIQNANILHKKIIQNELFWECSFKESKSSHIKGTESFVNSVPQFYFTPKYKYINLDPVFFQLKDIDDLMDVLPKEIDLLYNYKNEIIYILYNDTIWGINLKMYEFFMFNVNDLVDKISDRANKLYNDLDAIFYQKYYKIYPNFNLLKRFIVSILSKSE